MHDEQTSPQARIEYIAPDDLAAYDRNARRHSQKQIRQIADSIRAFGFNAPVLINAVNVVLAGHGRVAAARLLGLARIPCLRLDHLSEAQQRAYLLADNRVAEGATWDEELLAGELAELLQIPDLDFDIGVIGFSVAEVDALIEGRAPEEPDNPADDILPEAATARCRPGDIWQMGPHRLICGE
jgi:ParB-like chromosome segregation protein Spo0J